MYRHVWRNLPPTARRFFWASAALFGAWGGGEVLINLYLLEKGYSLALISTAWAAAALAQVVGALGFGWFGNRWPRHTLLLGGGIAQAFGAGLIVWAPEPWVVMAGFMLEWIGDAAFWVLGTAYLADVIAAGARPLAFGIRWAMYPGFLAVGRLAGGVLPGWFGGLVGYKFGLVAMLGLYLVMVGFRATLEPAGGSGAGGPPWRLRHRAAVASLAIHTFLSSASLMVILPYLNVIYARRFGLQVEAIGGAMGLEVGMQTLAILLAPLLGGQGRAVRLVTVLRLLLAPVLALMAWSPWVELFVALAVARGVLTMMVLPVIESFWVGIVDPEERPAVGAATAVAWGVGAAAGARAGGLLLEIDRYDLPFLLAAVLAALAVAWFYGAFRAYDRPAGATLPATANSLDSNADQPRDA